MDWGYKAALTTLAVAVVMMATRLFDRRVAGLLAGLPVITTPALLWLAHEQGAMFAARSATGSVAACAVAPLYALAFVATVGRCGLWAALPVALAVALATAGALHALPEPLAPSLLACAAACVAVCWSLRTGEPGSGVRPLRGEPWLSAGLAGCVAATVSQVSPVVGPFWSGLLSSLPVIGTFALVHLHRCGTTADLHRFVQGYLHGVWAKAAFAAVFALAAPHLGVAWALGLACASGAASVGLTTMLPRSAWAGRLLGAAARLREAWRRRASSSIGACADPPPT
jgi:hypothetical protein